jgi:putative peptide zinc metalloprotease protein
VAVSTEHAARRDTERERSRPREGVLALADGVELIGEYQGSGYRRPPLLARRGDGQVVQLGRLLYLVAEACDGHRDAQAVADAVSARYGRRISAPNVRLLADEQLRPAGVLAGADGSAPELPKRVALLALRHRRPILSERVVGVAAAAFAWLHRRPVQALVLLALAVFDFWLFGVHGIAAGLLRVLYRPEMLIAVLGLVVAATVFHEFGHASACRYGGARPGVMGVGVYLVWPALYCDVTDAYRLDRAGRLRTDLGGVYFNGIFALLAGGAYFATGEEALLFAAFLQHVIVLQQLLPLLRFDGYYVLSDLTGVPDILSRIKPIFRSLIPCRREPRVDELKPWVRVVVTAYLVVLVPVLALLVTWIVIAAPRLLATAHDSLLVQVDRVGGSSGAADVGAGALRIAALIMPLAAMAVSVGRSGRMAARGLAGWARGSVLRNAAALGVIATVAAVACSAWWPDGDYTPIRPGERGTIGDAITSLPEIAAKVPSLTSDGPSPVAPGIVTPAIERQQRALRHGPTGRAASGRTPSGRTTPPAAADDGVPDTRAQAPDSIWDDGDWSTARQDEAPSGAGSDTPDGPFPASTATPTPGPATQEATSEPAATPAPTTSPPTETSTPAPTETATPTPTPTETATPTPTATPIGTADPSPTASPPQTEITEPAPSLTPTP